MGEGVEAAGGGRVRWGLRPIEDVCRWIAATALVMMLVVVAAEVVLRSMFSVSLGFADEVSAYFLVMLCFFALAVTHARGGFHRVEFVVALLPPRGRAVMKLLAELLTLGFAAVLIWQFAKVELQAWQLGSVSPTVLQTPQWIPMLSMVVGTSLFFLSLLLSIVRTALAIAGRAPLEEAAA